MYKGKLLLLPIVACFSISVRAQQWISDKPQPGLFDIVSANNTATICTDPADFILVQKAASWLQQDIEAVTGKKPVISSSIPASAKTFIIIRSSQKSSLIRQLVQQKKITLDKI